MYALLRKWLNIYEDEVGLFLWAAFLLFLIHVANILFNNVAETAFLKRYGVQYLPIVTMINAVATFFIMGVITGFMARMPDSRLLSYMLVWSGLLVGALRFVIPLGIDLLYPVLFLLKSQLEVLLALVSWNMANDLFNTRQSKRIFPLLTAGGVVGAILGSFATAPLAKLIRFDNLLLAYCVISLISAAVVRRMGQLYPTLLVQDAPPAEKAGEKSKKGVSPKNIVQEFKKVAPLIKESTLVKVLIAFSLMANIVITIINYQFNFAVNENYATEGGMLHFFAVFRGFLNSISLVILLFVGKIYGKWGLPVSLLIHPINYVFAFLAFLFRFDIYSAMYARISTNVLRTTINNPAMAVLMGLFHPSQRALVRPFLRGTVVRIGTLLGSGIILVSGDLFHPRYLSIIAIGCMSVWLTYDFILKKQYPRILLDLISRNMLDLKSLEHKDVVQVFKDKKMHAHLMDRFLSSRGEDCLWYAELLRGQGIPDFDESVLKVMRKEEDDATRIGLMAFLSLPAGKSAIPVFKEIMDMNRPQLLLAMVKAANRFPAEVSRDFNREIFEATRDPEVKACSAVGLYRDDPERLLAVIQAMLDSGELAERRAGVVAAGEAGNEVFVAALREMVTKETDPSILSAIFRSLRQLKDSNLNDVLERYFTDPADPVRLGALEAFDIRDDHGLSAVIGFMGDPSPEISAKAIEKIHNGAYQNPLVLVESLNIPRRKVRDGLFQILEKLNIKNVDFFRFARSQAEKGYIFFAQVEALGKLPESPERDLLMDHLTQVRKTTVENILRVLSIQDTSGQMRIIWRGLYSSDSRRRSNSVEALSDLLDKALGKILVPLLEEMPSEERLRIGRKYFSLPDLGGTPEALVSRFLAGADWVASLLALVLVANQGMVGVSPDILQTLAASENVPVRHMARQALIAVAPDRAAGMDQSETGIDLAERILYLKKIGIFEGLYVSELAAIGSATGKVSYPAEEPVIREGDRGDTLYLIIDGEVSVRKEPKAEGGPAVEIDRIKSGDYFGEMALFQEAPRSATIQTISPSLFLVLHKREFTQIVQEYPQIALHICRTLSGRIRNLHEKIKENEKQAG